MHWNGKDAFELRQTSNNLIGSANTMAAARRGAVAHVLEYGSYTEPNTVVVHDRASKSTSRLVVTLDYRRDSAAHLAGDGYVATIADSADGKTYECIVEEDRNALWAVRPGRIAVKRAS